MDLSYYQFQCATVTNRASMAMRSIVAINIYNLLEKDVNDQVTYGYKLYDTRNMQD